MAMGYLISGRLNVLTSMMKNKYYESVIVFNATFNNISVISWRSVLLVEETGENHRPAASRWQTLSHNIHRRSWHGPPPFYSNFLFTNLFSIKFLYFFIISSLFPYFNLFVSIFIQSYVNIKLHVSTLYYIDTNNIDTNNY